MCETCGCSVTPGNAHLHSAQRGDPARSSMCCRICSPPMIGSRAHNREHFDAHGVLAINLMSSPGAGKTALLEATIVALKRPLPHRRHRGRSRDRQRCGPHPRPRRAGGADHDRDRLSSRCAPRASGAAPAAARRTRSAVHRKCGQSRVSRELRSRAALERHVAQRHRGRRQAGEVPGDLSRHRSRGAEQDRPARRDGRFRSGARRRGACARSAATHR